LIYYNPIVFFVR